jgi:hypothetical protein
VYTKSPARIPNYLNGEGYKEYDGNYRLRALNREFQRRIARLDPARQDFENVIRHYVSARASIGADLGLYQRVVAGTKRKNDTIEEELDVPQQYKKPKNGATQSAQALSSSAPANVFSAPAPQVGQQNMFASNKVASNATANTTSPSKATSLLNNMIPGSLGNSVAAAEKITSASAAGGSFLRDVVTSIEESGSSADQFKPRTTSTTPKKSPSKPPFAAPPSVFSGNAFAAFGQAAASGEKKRKAARLEEDYDSDEDSQAEGKKQLEEEERAKRARYDAIPKTGFTPLFGPTSTSPKTSPSKAKRHSPFEEDSDDDVEAEADDEETAEERDGSFVPDEEESSESEEDEEAENGAEEELAEEEIEDLVDDGNDTDDVDRQAEIDANPNRGKSLFDRVEPNPERKNEAKVNGDTVEPKSINSGFKFDAPKQSPFSAIKNDAIKSTPEAPAYSPLTPASTSSYKPGTFSFRPPATTTPTPVLGSSILAGGTNSTGFEKFEGMFGSRPSTPNPPETEKETPAASGPVNHTWQAGSPIRFSSSAAPDINVTEASPEKDTGNDKTPKPAFGGLFGTSAPSSTTQKAGSGSLGFSFAPKPAPGFLGASKSLAPDSGLSSGLSSRGTSPGLTDNESVATNDTDGELAVDPQASYGESRAGEEDEDVLFEAKSKALRFITKDAAVGSLKDKADNWVTEGVGVLRLLKHKETSKTRIVFRIEPGGNIVINSNLLPSIHYKSMPQAKTGAAQGGFWNAENKRVEKWVFKLKTAAMGDELAEKMAANQNN